MAGSLLLIVEILLRNSCGKKAEALGVLYFGS